MTYSEKYSNFILEARFRHWIQNLKGNSHNSDFFLYCVIQLKSRDKS